MKALATILPTTTAALVLLASAQPADAQRRGHDDGAAAQRGAPTLSLEMMEDRTTLLGIWGRLSDEVSLGVEGQLDWTTREREDPVGGEVETKTSRMGVGLSAKWYLTSFQSIAPFLYAHGGIVREETEVEEGGGETETGSTQTLARGALGLEWFASRSFSVGANVGVLWRGGEEDVDGGDEEAEPEISTLDVFTTGISVAYHF